MLIPAALQTVFNSFRSLEGSAGHPDFRPEDFLRAMRETFPLLPGFAYGALAGTGAALRVGQAAGDDIDVVNAELLFKPSVVLVINLTDPGLLMFEHHTLFNPLGHRLHITTRQPPIGVEPLINNHHVLRPQV